MPESLVYYVGYQWSFPDGRTGRGSFIQRSPVPWSLAALGASLAGEVRRTTGAPDVPTVVILCLWTLPEGVTP